MQPFLLPPMERIRNWREFRQSFGTDETDEEQLLKTAKYWQSFPISKYYLDIDDPKNWPTPWEILYEGDYCQSTLAYMMEQTLLLADERWTTDRLKLYLIDDKVKSDIFIILVADAKYVINYSHFDIINFDFVENNCIIQHEYLAVTPQSHTIV